MNHGPLAPTAAFAPPPLLDPTLAAQWAGQIRALMPFIGGGLAALGVVLPSFTDAQLAGYVYAVMTLIGFGSYAAAALWSWRQKRAAKKAAREAEVAAAVASANAGKPVTVTVTPPGMPNEAVLITATEAAAAPSVPRNVAPSPPPKAA